jgi:hypothetical protein
LGRTGRLREPEDNMNTLTWATVTVEFTARPEGAEDKANEIAYTIQTTTAQKPYRPTHRSRIAWEDGTLDYIYEASIQIMDSAVEAGTASVAAALLERGLVDSDAAVSVTL